MPTIPYDIGRGEVLALQPEAPEAHPPEVAAGDRVLAPAYNPHRYVRHIPATVVDLDGDRAVVAYDPGHGVNHFGPVHRGRVFRVDLRPL